MNLRIIGMIAVLFLPALASAQQADGAKYIGYEYKNVNPGKTLANGVKSMGGGLIGDVRADPAYEIAEVEKGKVKMLWLNVSTGLDSTGVTGWKVLDVLSFPTLLKSDYLLVYGDPGIQCVRGGKDIPNLVGVGRILRKQRIFKPSKLWIANIETKKFELTPIRGVKCEYSEP